MLRFAVHNSAQQATIPIPGTDDSSNKIEECDIPNINMEK
jgi:hypothetical protein